MSSILVFLERKPLGGAERATSLILELLANEGFNLTIVTGAKNMANLKNVKWVYSPLLDVPSKLRLWLTMHGPQLNQFGELIKKSDVVYIPRLAYPVIPLAKKYGKKVVVHLHDYQPLSYCATIYSRYEQKYNTSLFSDMKVSLRHELLANKGAQRAGICSLVTFSNRLCEQWLSKADEIVCVSKRQREIIESAAPELMNRLSVIYNPLPKLPLVEKKRLNKPSLLYLGGDSYIKGLYAFLNASYCLLKQDPNVRFLLTRDFEDTGRAIIGELNRKFDGAYKLLGQLSYKDILNIHSTSLALLFPSIWEEPLPYAVIEAMLAETIPIASRVGGVPEIVQRTYAEKMMFTPHNVDELVDKMEEVLSLSTEQLIHFGTGLRKSILRRFDINIIKSQLVDIFNAW